MFYEIEIVVWHGSESGSTKTTSNIKRNKIFYKDDLIYEAKRETDSRLISQLNWHYKDCQFNFKKAYHRYGVTFWATAIIRSRINGKSDLVYDVEWDKNYWDLEHKQYLAKTLELR